MPLEPRPTSAVGLSQKGLLALWALGLVHSWRRESAGCLAAGCRCCPTTGCLTTHLTTTLNLSTAWLQSITPEKQNPDARGMCTRNVHTECGHITSAFVPW